MALDAWPIETLTYSGQELRMGTVLPFSIGDGTGLGARSAVRSSGGGTDLRVQPQSSPNMTVKVSPAVAVIQGAASSLQGPYTYALDAVTNLTISAAHASLSRTDRIVVRIRDSTFDTSGQKDSGLIVITGTPGAGTPAVPTDATYYTLALIVVTAAKTSIVTGDISDQRLFYASVGGTIECTSTTRPSNVPVGQRIRESDTDCFLWWNGAAWQADGAQRALAQQVLGSNTATITFSSIPSYFTGLVLEITARSTTAAVSDNIRLRFNGDSTSGHYYDTSFQATNAGGASGNVTYVATIGGTTSMTIGDVYAASAGLSTVAGSVLIEVPHYGNASWAKNVVSRSSMMGGANWTTTQRYGGWSDTSAITSITLLLNSGGNFATNSRFTLIGMP